MRRWRRHWKSPGGGFAEGYGDCAGESGGVNEVGGAELAGVGNAVGQDEAAFGIGVDDLDGLAGTSEDRDMAVCTSPGFCAVPEGMFSAAQTMAMTADFGLEQRDGAHGCNHGSAAGHIVLHLLHIVGRLDGDAAGIKGDAFADEAEDGAILSSVGTPSGS